MFSSLLFHLVKQGGKRQCWNIEWNFFRGWSKPTTSITRNVVCCSDSQTQFIIFNQAFRIWSETGSYLGGLSGCVTWIGPRIRGAVLKCFDNRWLCDRHNNGVTRGCLEGQEPAWGQGYFIHYIYTQAALFFRGRGIREVLDLIPSGRGRAHILIGLPVARRLEINRLTYAWISSLLSSSSERLPVGLQSHTFILRFTSSSGE